MILDNLRRQKIAIVGLGKNNQKLAQYFTNLGITHEVIDGWKNLDELTGKLDQFQIIYRTPGLPYLSQAVQQALAKGVVISSQTKLFFELCPAPIIGVTGTKGKGTTSSLLTSILQAANKKVWLAGNIGRDPFEFLDEIHPSDYVILELSSFQLQDLSKSAHIAIVLNIGVDHLNHHKSVEEYLQAKSSILKFQSKDDFAILHKNLPSQFRNLGSGKKIIFDEIDVVSFQTKLLGRHNLTNISAAVSAAKLIKIDDATIKKAVADFEPLEHRLKVIGTVEGVMYVDDAFSTNIEPTIAAIDAISTPLVLIIGGFDKGLDFASLGQKILSAKNLKGLVIIGQVTDKILKSVAGFKGQILTGAKNMAEILSQARSLAKSGDSIVFSPATSSFDMFKNEFDRGEQFVSEVNKL